MSCLASVHAYNKTLCVSGGWEWHHQPRSDNPGGSDIPQSVWSAVWHSTATELCHQDQQWQGIHQFEWGAVCCVRFTVFHLPGGRFLARCQLHHKCEPTFFPSCISVFLTFFFIFVYFASNVSTVRDELSDVRMLQHYKPECWKELSDILNVRLIGMGIQMC